MALEPYNTYIPAIMKMEGNLIAETLIFSVRGGSSQ